MVRRSAIGTFTLAMNAALFLISASFVTSYECPAFSGENDQCAVISSWEEFRETVKGATGLLVICPGTVYSDGLNAAIINSGVNLVCKERGGCKIEGSGRFISIKETSDDVIIQGFQFEGAKDTAIQIRQTASGRSTFCDCDFINNEKEDASAAGAIRATDNTIVDIVSSTFIGNSADVGGAILNKGTMHIVSSNFDGNSAAAFSGVVSNDGPNAKLTVSGTRFSGSVGAHVLSTNDASWTDEGGNSAIDGICRGVSVSSPDVPDGECFFFDGVGNRQTSEPTSVPASAPSSLQLGVLETNYNLGLKVAKGLAVERVARSGQSVKFTSNQSSQGDSGDCRFHYMPDGAQVFDAGNDNWYYCSNAEVGSTHAGHAGVYCILFDRDGEVKDYKHRLGDDSSCGESFPRTRRNCNCGKTPWNTYVSCEEFGSGRCWQVDPAGFIQPRPIEAIGYGKWEQMATDDSNPVCPVFYFTEDNYNGKIRRFRPNPDCDSNHQTGWNMLHGGGEVDYLAFDECIGNSGSFRWTNNAADAEKTAENCFPNAEGIAYVEASAAPHNRVYFVSKVEDKLFVLYHEDETGGLWESDTTNTNAFLEGDGSFEGGPDQISPFEHDFMFHSTDGGSTPGMYLHNLQTKKYYTFWQQLASVRVPGEESVGFAVSPDKKFIISALQESGQIFKIWRKDGQTFSGMDFRLRRRAR